MHSLFCINGKKSGWRKSPKTDLYISIGDKMRLFHHTVTVLQIYQKRPKKQGLAHSFCTSGFFFSLVNCATDEQFIIALNVVYVLRCLLPSEHKTAHVYHCLSCSRCGFSCFYFLFRTSNEYEKTESRRSRRWFTKKSRLFNNKKTHSNKSSIVRCVTFFRLKEMLFLTSEQNVG